jgi:hypothetical protein
MGKGLLGSVAGIFAVAALVLVFQNCGQSGFQSTETDTLGSQGINPNIPFPITFNINQIGAMSCPKAGANPVSGDHMSNAYFNLRYGAYDNSTLSFVGAKNQGGLKLRQEFIDFVKSTHGAVNSDLVTRTLSASGYLEGERLAAGLIAVEGQRSRDYMAFTGLVAPVLDGLSSGAIVGDLAASASINSQTGIASAQALNYFSQASGNLRSMTGSLSFSKAEEDVDTLYSELSNNYLFLGMTSDAAGTNAAETIAGLMSPTGDITSTIFAKGYKLDMAPKSTGPAYISNVTEYDLSTASPQNLTQSQNQNWQCFTVSIVRDIDRKYATNAGQVVHSNDVYASSATLIWHEFQSSQEIVDVENQMNLIPGKFNTTGTHKLCPVQTMASIDTAQNKEKLKIIRRFLPADLWEVNSELLCAVPTRKVFDQKEKCYASGDDTPQTPIQYNMVNCGPGKRECPAAVSICTRVD